jgi:membrane protein implicated in regulation of membrane protease activity
VKIIVLKNGKLVAVEAETDEHYQVEIDGQRWIVRKDEAREVAV